MMKKFFLILLIISSLFIVTSCKNESYVCYYAYFKDSSFILVYSYEKNTLYEVKIPVEIVSQWGRHENISSVQQAMESFAGLDSSGFMFGIPQALDTCREVLNAMSPEKNPTGEDRLSVLSKKAADFSNDELLQKMNSLCGADLSALISVLRSKNAGVCILDTAEFIDASDPVFSRDYFKKFITQVIYE